MDMGDFGDLLDKDRTRRIFRTRNKISFPGAICHLTQRAAGKEPLFLEDEDYLFMLYLLKRNAKEFCFDIFAYALMPNHIHLLIRLTEDNLSKGMGNIFREYAIYFNTKYERKGHVFGGAFRQALCLNDSYLVIASLYIHLNPMKANLVDDPVKYQWSSCGLYIEPFKKETFINYGFILKFLDENIEKARIDYGKALYDSMALQIQGNWIDHKTRESFGVEVMRCQQGLMNRIKKSQEDFLDEESLDGKIENLKLRGRLHSPESIRARKYLIEQLRARGYSIEMIAKKFNASRQTIYNTLTLQSDNEGM